MCRLVWIESAAGITFHVLERSHGYVMLLGTDAGTYIFKEDLFMLVDEKKIDEDHLTYR